MINGPDLSFDGANPAMTYLDGYGHGTHLAGIINGDTAAARGLAPASRVVNVRVGAADGAVDVSQVIAAIDWVVQHRNDNGMNIRVLVLAYGTDGTQSYEIDPLTAAVENAWRNGIVVVAAAGNRGDTALSLDNPAIDPYVIAVGASETNGTFTTSDDTLAPFNSAPSATRGVDLLAPGRSVVSLRVPNSFVDLAHPEGRVSATQFRGSGSSQAAAVVGAAAALVLGDRPALTPDQVKCVLLESARAPARRRSGPPGRRRPRRRRGRRRRGSATPASACRRGRRRRAPVRSRPPAAPSTSSIPTATSSPASRRCGPAARGRAARGPARAGRAVVVGRLVVGRLVVGRLLVGRRLDRASPGRAARGPAAHGPGGSWSGGSWSGQSWSGQSWSGGSWSGTSWSGGSWSGGSWSGGSWSGTSWSGGSWSGQPSTP